jgi:FkbM family methyltransferase
MPPIPSRQRQDDLILDVGMHVAKDTEYYLAKGFRVAAVEANPELASAGSQRLAKHRENGRLKIFNVAICEKDGPVVFFPESREVRLGHDLFGFGGAE